MKFLTNNMINVLAEINELGGVIDAMQVRSQTAAALLSRGLITSQFPRKMGDQYTYALTAAGAGIINAIDDYLSAPGYWYVLSKISKTKKKRNRVHLPKSAGVAVWH